MKTVILAAGMGRRLRPLTSNMPKPLIPLLGKPLIEHVLSSFLESGISDFIIVTGYLGDLLKKKLEKTVPENLKLSFIHNPKYRMGNASSLLCAEKKLRNEESFILSMADHIVDRTIIRNAVNQYRSDSLLCVDEDPLLPRTVEEATKVYVNKEGMIKKIGKEINEWNGVDTGIFHLNTDFFNLFDTECELSKVSECMRRLINQSSLAACDVTGLPWIDVDTKFDLIKAERMLKEWV